MRMEQGLGRRTFAKAFHQPVNGDTCVSSGLLMPPIGHHQTRFPGTWEELDASDWSKIEEGDFKVVEDSSGHENDPPP